MSERDDEVLQNAAEDLPHRSLYKSKEWARQQALENRSDDISFPAKSSVQIQQLNVLRDAIRHFFDRHLPTFDRVSDNIRKLCDGLHALLDGKDETSKLVDPALLKFLKALQEKLVHVRENRIQYERDVETQLPTNGSSLAYDLKQVSERANAAALRTVAMVEESLRNLATGSSPRFRMPPYLFRQLESIYQGHWADKKSLVDNIMRQCPSDVAEILNALNRLMTAESTAQFLANPDRIRESLIIPLGKLSADLGALDRAMEDLGNLNISAKCIRQEGEVAALAARHLIAEQLRISLESTIHRIEGE